MSQATTSVAAAPAEVADLVERVLGEHVVGLVPIKANVARLQLDGPTATAIVKRSRPKLAGTSAPDGHHAEFAHELLTHRFLLHMRPDFTATPRLLGATDHLLLMEDLGRSTDQESIGDAVAQSLAALHDATAAQRGRYEQMRDEAGLGVDHRMYSHEQYGRLFAIGARELVQTCSALAIEVGLLTRALDAAATALTCNPARDVLVHDDLLSTRQMVLRDGVCHLLDWEMGKLAHPLADVAKVLLGKLDRKAGTNAYVLKHMDLDMSFADAYRQMRTSDDPLLGDDVLWSRQLGAVLLHTTIVNLGAQSCVVPGHRPLEGAAALRRTILTRLLAVPVDDPVHRSALDVIRRVRDAELPEGGLT